MLPIWVRGKLMFPLCGKCSEDVVQEDCPHEDPQDRTLHGTWVSLEVTRAVELGYKVLEVYEIWQYKMTTYDETSERGGIFTGYIDYFFKQKIEASGYPLDCDTDEKNVNTSKR